MPTIEEKFPKADNTRAQVEAERQECLNRGATSSEITEDATNWILTTVMD